MKKFTMKLLALALCIVFILSGCGTNPQNSQNDTDENHNTTSSSQENRFINCEPGRDQSGDNPLTPVGSRTKTKTYGSYLATNLPPR